MAGLTLPPCFATPSLGMHPSHTLPIKLKAAAEAGFTLVEVGFDDLLAWTEAERKPKRTGKAAAWAPDEPDPFGDEELWAAIEAQAGELLKLLGSLGLGVLLLQPFSQFEGWAPGSDRRKWTFAKAEHWLRVGQIIKAQALQVGSNDQTDSSSDFTQLAADLAELADMAKQYGMRASYEPWCWAAHAPTWETTLDIVQRADRDNLTLCLDTFQIAGGPDFADPASTTGWAHADSEKRLADSLEHLARICPPEKVLLLQVSDATRLDPPIGKGSHVDGDYKPEEGVKTREVWSHGCRPLPYKGGYLPVEAVTRALVKTGWRGPLSYEVFELSQAENDASIPTRWARDGMAAHERLVRACADLAR